MDHDYIDEHDIASQYLRDELDPRERERFEDHAAGCAECMDRIALAEIFLLGSARKAAAVQPAPPAPRQAYPEARAHPVLPSAAPPVTREVPVDPQAFALNRREPAIRRKTRKESPRYFSLRLAHVDSRAAIAMAVVLLIGPPAAFLAGLLSAKAGRTEAAAPPPEPARASAAIIMPLMRGVNRISVASSTVLMLDAKAESANSTYRVRIIDSWGSLAWERDLQATPGGPIAVIVPPGALQPGTYLLQLMALAPDGSQIKLDDYTISAGA